jgi:hypothetical protein
MHAVVVTVSIDPEHMKEAAEQLLSTVVPGVKQLPGLISGYWFAPIDGHGLSVTLFESEQAAQTAADGIPNRPTPDYVKFDTIDVREVIAQV